MAKDRAQVPDLYRERLNLPQTKIVASPVDTFVQPGHPVQANSDRQIQELIGAFQDIQPGLSKFAAQRVDQVNQEDLVAGHKAALSNKAQFKEAVNKGAIPAGVSPWFQVGWERQKAEVASTDFDRELREAYSVSGLSEQNDPAKFNGWVADFTSNWQEMHPEHKDNPEFQPIFNGLASKSQDNLANQHAAERTRKIEADVIQNTSLQLSRELDYPSDNQAKRMGEIMSTQVANGLNGQLANKLVAEAVVQKAIENEDLYLLDTLQDIPSGSGVVGQIGFVKEMVMNARDKITASKTHGEHLSRLELKDKRDTLINQVRGDAYRKIAENPYADTTEEFKKLSFIDPDEAAKVESFRTAYLGSKNAQNKVIESDALKTDLLLSAMKGELTETAVHDAINNHEIDFETAKDLLTNHIPKAKENKSIFRDPTVSDAYKNLRMAITKNDSQGDDADVLAGRANSAGTSFLKAMIQYKRLKPDALESDVLDYASSYSQKLLKIYGPPPDVQKNGQVTPSEAPLDLNTSDPTKDKLFPDARAFKDALAEAQTAGLSSGKIKALADIYQMTPSALIRSQKALYQEKAPTK